jgi:hypothetical protein
MILTVEISQAELKRIADLEMHLRELSLLVNETETSKKFTPQPGNLVQFINLLARFGAVYEVTSDSIS